MIAGNEGFNEMMERVVKTILGVVVVLFALGLAIGPHQGATSTGAAVGGVASR